MKTGHTLLISASLIIAALVFGIFFYSARSSEDTINVVGMATKRFDSDIVNGVSPSDAIPVLTTSAMVTCLYKTISNS